MRTQVVQLICAVILVVSAGASANEVSEIKDPLLQAVVDIEMTEEQKAAFQTNLKEFMEDVASSTRKLMRRNNETGVQKKIIRKRKQLLNRLDKQMSDVLTEEQFPRYEKYRTLLYARMNGAGNQQQEGTTGFSTMMGSAHSGT